MCSLEESIVPTLKDCLVHWRRYVDDTHAYIEPDKIDYVMKKLNTYHKQIQFTYELEKDQRISFLDVSIRRLTKMENLKQQFLRKRQTQIYTELELSWTYRQRKIGTLKNLVKRSILLCSNQHLLQKELTI